MVNYFSTIEDVRNAEITLEKGVLVLNAITDELIVQVKESIKIG